MSKQAVCHQINNYGFVHCTHNFIMIGLTPKDDKVNLSVSTNTDGAPIALDGTAARVSVNIAELYFKREKAEIWDPKLPLIEWAVPFSVKAGLPLKIYV